MSIEGVKRYLLTYFIILGCKLIFYIDFNAGIGLVRMMGMTNYLALVGGGRSPKFAMNKVRHISPTITLFLLGANFSH